MWRVLENGEEVCAIPVPALVDEVPRYVRDVEPPAYLAELHAWTPDSRTLEAEPLAALEALLRSPTIAHKRWVWEQYDHSVQAGTVLGPGAQAALLAVRGASRGLALTVDGNGRYVYCDPWRGGALAVAEAARNLTAVGARPLAVTDCLNFGNPEKDPVYHQFVESLRGIAAACRALDTPVVSGNVSFYNESAGGAIHPTPTIGMVGLVEDLERRVSPRRGDPGDVLLEVGGPGTHLGASSFLVEVAGKVAGRAPAVDLAAERRNADALRGLAVEGRIRTMRDVSDGGLAVAACELLFALAPNVGLELDPGPGDVVPALFGEDAARYVVVVEAPERDAVLAALTAARVPARVCGRLTDDGRLAIEGVGARERVAIEAAWRDTLPDIMQRWEDQR